MLAFIAIARDSEHHSELLASRKYSEAAFYLVGRPGDSIEVLAKLLPSSVTRIETPDGEYVAPVKVSQEQVKKSVSIVTDYPRRDDIAAVTCFFNPAGFKTLRRNYDTFAAKLEADGVPLYTVELAYDNEPFTITGPNVIGVRAKSRMFHKEQLLNIGIAALPDQFSKVAWIDCDLTWDRDNWLWEASELLDDYQVCQCFKSVAERDRNGVVIKTSDGLAQRRKAGGGYGRPGFAWASRRSLIEAAGGLFDKCIVGSGDRVFADYGCYGEFDQSFFNAYPSAIRLAAKAWARDVFAHAQGRVGVVDCEVTHLWHGDLKERGYGTRDALVMGFQDSWLSKNKDGVDEWTTTAPLHVRQAVLDYFKGRNEDGQQNATQ